MLLSHFLYEKSKIVSFASLTIKIVVFPVRSKFTVKLIRYVAFGSASSACYLPKSIAINL